MDNPLNMKEVNQVVAAVVESVSEDEARQPKRYCATVFPGPQTEIDRTFAESVLQLESLLGMSLWLIVQNGSGSYKNIDDALADAVYQQRTELFSEKPVGLLIHSWGGVAHSAYRIGRIFQRRCKNLTAVIPNVAKSAATLLSLSASSIVFGPDAEVGPLDVQMWESDREEWSSALNAVQALERMNAFSTSAIEQLVPLLKRRTEKKLDTLLPLVLDYVTNFVSPLLAKIDTVEYTKKSRELKVAEEYAIRLMMPNYPLEEAERIARALVENYPAHEFVIDRNEAITVKTIKAGKVFGLGLKSTQVSPEAGKALDLLGASVPKANIIGRVVEMKG